MTITYSERARDQRAQLLTPEQRALDQRAQLLTPEQAAQDLGVGRTSVFALIKAGRLRSVKIGRLRRIPVSEVRRFVESLESDDSSAADGGGK